MRILFVAMSNSIHTARWILQIADQGWNIHLFPSIDVGRVNPQLKNVTIHHSCFCKQDDIQPTIKVKGFPVFSPRVATGLRILANNFFPHYRIVQLKKLIKKFKPDIIHTMETQHAGYLILELLKRYNLKLPIWVHSIWGSDLYLFSRLKKHKEKVKKVLSYCHYLSCEGQRDILLAKSLGFKGKFLPIIQATGGFNLEKCLKFRKSGPSSSRRIIALKGYQHWAGRALVGLRALERCQDLLKNYKIIIYSALPDHEVSIAAEIFSDNTGIPTQIIPPETEHDEILKIIGQSRISIGLSISDGVPNSMLESMVMGAFPIQSNTSCADEWIKNGETGILVPPEDPDVIEKALRRALIDNALIDHAAEYNLTFIKERLDQNSIKKRVVDLYKTILSGNYRNTNNESV